MRKITKKKRFHFNDKNNNSLVANSKALELIKKGANSIHFNIQNSSISLEDLLNKIAKATSENKNSMWADLDSGRGTEIDSILGIINKELKSDFLSGIIRQLTL